MKKITALILCYDFEPLNSVATHRIVEWRNNLNKYGVYPIIVTRNWNENLSENNFIYNDSKIKEVKCDTYTVCSLPLKKSLLEKCRDYLKVKDLNVLSRGITLCIQLVRWLPFIDVDKCFYLNYGDKLVKKYAPDIIIASGEPFVLFKYAKHIAFKNNLPFAIDYRDGWSTNVFTQNGLLKYVSIYESFFEKNYLKQALFSTIAAEYLKKEIFQKFGKQNMFVVENGADLETINSIPNFNNINFEIVYAGSIYAKQNVSVFLEAFVEFVKMHCQNAKIKFIGVEYYTNRNTTLIQKFANSYPNNIIILPRMTKANSIKKAKEASVLLKFSSGPVVDGFYGAKLYEYAALNKPILTVANSKENAVSDFFEDSGIQTLVYDKGTCLNALIDYNEKFINGLLNKEYLSESQIFSISRENQTAIFAEIIKKELQK